MRDISNVKECLLPADNSRILVIPVVVTYCLRNRLTAQNAVPESGQRPSVLDTLHSSCTSSGDQSDRLDSVMFHPLPVVPVIHDIHRPLLLLNHVSLVPDCHVELSGSPRVRIYPV